MNQPTEPIHSLIARATPEERIHIHGERIVFTKLNDGCRGVPIMAVEYAYLPGAQGDLALAARCSPATLRVVVEALEWAEKSSAPQSGLRVSCRRALSLLNGHATANGRGEGK